MEGLSARLLKLEADKLKIEEEVEQERTKNLDNQAQVKELTNGAIKKAFTILFAYIIQQFYFQTYRNLAYNKPYSATETFVVRFSWFAIVVILCPIMIRSARGIQSSGARMRFFMENVHSLWGASIMMMVGWAFKDVCKAFMDLRAPPPESVSFTGKLAVGYRDGSGYRARHCGYLLALAIGGVLFNYLFTEGSKALDRCCAKKDNSFAQIMAQCGAKFGMARPLSLGVGLLCNGAMEGPWNYFLLRYAVEYDNDTPPVERGTFNFRYQIFMWVRVIVHTSLIVYLLIWFNNRKSTGRMGKVGTGLLDTFVHSTQFNLAWSWADLTNFNWFDIFYNCAFPYQACGDATIWLKFYYALVLTVLMVLIVPVLKAKEGLIKSLSGVYASQMLKRDKMAIRSEKVYNALYNAMFGIIVGWGWTGLLAAECANSISYTFTCPTEHTFKTIFLFACNSAFYIFLACGAYHLFTEKESLELRAIKVAQIEHGEADRFFKEVDSDNNRHIDESEMEKFVTSYGFDVECFKKSFDQSTKYPGEHGEEVEINQFIDVFGKVVHEEDKLMKARKAAQGEEVPEIPCRNDSATATQRTFRHKEDSGAATELKSTATKNPLADEVLVDNVSYVVQG